MKEWGDPLFCLYYEVKRLAARKKSGNTAQIVWKLAEPIAQELGLTIWDVRFLKEGSEWYLRIFIDKPEGIEIEDCEKMSRAINKPLDELDPIEQSYCLEVCSPGIDRELVRPEHFQAYLGAAVWVKLIRPMDSGEREIAGILQSYENQEMTISLEDGEIVSIAKKDTSSVRLIDDIVEEERA